MSDGFSIIWVVPRRTYIFVPLLLQRGGDFFIVFLALYLVSFS